MMPIKVTDKNDHWLLERPGNLPGSPSRFQRGRCTRNTSINDV